MRIFPSHFSRVTHTCPTTHAQVVNNLKAGVVEPAMSKIKSLRFATEAAISILRVDDFITINPPREEQRGR